MKHFPVETDVVILEEVVRQSRDSGILYNATTIRTLIAENKIVIPKIRLKGFQDIRRIYGNEMQEILSDCYDKYGIKDTIVLCRSNKYANKYNAGIRSNILYREEVISKGDLLMVVKNNYYWFQQEEGLEFIANGDIVEIVHIYGIQEMYGFYFADVVVRLTDYDVEIETRLMLDVLTIDSASLNTERNKEFFYKILEDYEDIKPKRKQYEAVRNNEYFNALQVKYAYAVTCHKSQGGQWKTVFIDQGYFRDDMLSVEYLRWLYTAITRATEKVYLVNFPDEFFE
jgi:exodeoxyribonuclease-5